MLLPPDQNDGPDERDRDKSLRPLLDSGFTYSLSLLFNSAAPLQPAGGSA
jgi:hypothetical protein